MTAALLSLFKLLAHHASGADPHLQPGVHLRWFSAPPLNLPFDLFQVERADASGFREFFSEEVSWFNRFGQGVGQPFTLAPGEEVIGVLPAGEDVLGVEVRFIPAQSIGLSGTGEVATPNGYQPVAAMSPNGWLLTPGIQRLRLRGPGRILGARWVQLSTLEPNMVFEPVALFDERLQRERSQEVFQFRQKLLADRLGEHVEDIPADGAALAAMVRQALQSGFSRNIGLPKEPVGDDPGNGFAPAYDPDGRHDRGFSALEYVAALAVDVGLRDHLA